MLVVDVFNTDNGDVLVRSDKETLSEQTLELNQMYAIEVAKKHAASVGAIVTGTRDIGGRFLRYYDKESMEDVSGQVHSDKYRDRPELLIVRRLVRLTLSNQGGSTLGKLQSMHERTKPQPVEAQNFAQDDVSVPAAKTKSKKRRAESSS